MDRDEELAFLPLRDLRALPFLDGLDEDEQYATWRLAFRDGSVVGYGDGLTRLLETMRLTRFAARLVSRIPASLLDSVYGTVSRHRETLGKVVPDRPGPRRFP
ncbi:MAG: hypothetical protein H0U30_04295 [Actinobacteria bacterium]|nr:hypothetical protein [Actinomycetota bacterium]